MVQGQLVELSVSRHGLKSYVKKLQFVMKRYQARLDWLMSGTYTVAEICLSWCLGSLKWAYCSNVYMPCVGAACHKVVVHVPKQLKEAETMY